MVVSFSSCFATRSRKSLEVFAVVMDDAGVSDYSGAAEPPVRRSESH